MEKQIMLCLYLSRRKTMEWHKIVEWLDSDTAKRLDKIAKKIVISYAVQAILPGLPTDIGNIVHEVLHHTTDSDITLS